MAVFKLSSSVFHSCPCSKKPDFLKRADVAANNELGKTTLSLAEKGFCYEALVLIHLKMVAGLIAMAPREHRARLEEQATMILDAEIAERGR